MNDIIKWILERLEELLLLLMQLLMYLHLNWPELYEFLLNLLAYIYYLFDILYDLMERIIQYLVDLMRSLADFFHALSVLFKKYSKRLELFTDYPGWWIIAIFPTMIVLLAIWLAVISIYSSFKNFRMMWKDLKEVAKKERQNRKPKH